MSLWFALSPLLILSAGGLLLMLADAFSEKHTDLALGAFMTFASAGIFAVALIAIVVIGLICYFGFTKNNPFSQPFQFQAVFSSANSIRPKCRVSPASTSYC